MQTAGGFHRSNLEVTESKINRYVKIPLIEVPQSISDIIVACSQCGMAFQERQDSTGYAPSVGAYLFYRCSTYGAVTIIECLIASKNKYYTGTLINTVWSGWSEH